MIINHNLSSMNALHYLNANNNALQDSLSKLSSGKRINSAADDAAGLAISQKMQGQIDGLNQSSRNAQDGISMIQTAEGALNETHSILQRMRDLATQSANDTNTAQDRQNIQQEVDQLAQEMTRISNTTQFNTQNLLAGGLNDTFQIGANQGQTMNIKIGALDAATLGVTAGAGASITTGTNVTSASLATGATLSSGNYVIDGSVTTAATKGTVAGSVDVRNTGLGTSNVTIDSTHDTLAVTVDGSTQNIVLNNNVYDGTTGKDQNTLTQDLQSKLDTAFGSGKVTVGVDATTGHLTLTSSSVGSSSNVSVAGGTAATALFGSSTVAGTAGSDATYTLNLKDTSGNSIQSLTGQTTGTVNFASGLTVNTNMAALDQLASGGTIAASNIQVFQASQAATTGPNGQVVSQATVNKGILVDTQAHASAAITSIDNAIATVSSARSALGAYENRLQHTINNLDTASQNLTSASSRITDVDMASEMANFTKDNVLQQAAVSMLAQANQQPQMVLKLLG